MIGQNFNLHLLTMSKKKIIFFLILFILSNCSFDNKTGIWDGSEDEEKRVSELEIENKKVLSVEKVYSSNYAYEKEINLSKRIILSSPKKNFLWSTPNLNSQNCKIAISGGSGGFAPLEPLTK